MQLVFAKASEGLRETEGFFQATVGLRQTSTCRVLIAKSFQVKCYLNVRF